jgi:hypothetical protein
MKTLFKLFPGQEGPRAALLERPLEEIVGYTFETFMVTEERGVSGTASRSAASAAMATVSGSTVLRWRPGKWAAR